MPLLLEYICSFRKYNAFGKLVKESDGKYEWEYSYRPSGQRYRKSRTGGGSEETEYNLWLGEKLLGGLDQEKAISWVYTYGLEKLRKTEYEYEWVEERPYEDVPAYVENVWKCVGESTSIVAESRFGYTEETDAFGVQQEEKDGFATEVSYRG